MMNFFRKLFNESNRVKHVWLGVLAGLITTFVGATLVGLLVEFYDKRRGGKFDKYDLLATVVGGVVGTAVAAFFVYFYYQSGIWQVAFFLAINTAFVWVFGAFFDGFWWFPRAIYDITIGLLKDKIK